MKRILLLLMMLIAPSAMACECAEELTSEMARQAPHVFVFRVISLEVGEVNGERYAVGKIRVIANVRGKTTTREIYYREEDTFRSSLTWGVTLTVLVPLIINVAGVTKMMPLTGMPLPFISYGGTSLVTMWSRVGMLMRLEKESFLEA